MAKTTWHDVSISKTKWHDCSPNGYCAVVNDYVLQVYESGTNWKWTVDYYDKIADGVAKSERGAKTAASKYARRNP
jgi:hypothetical protein